MAQQLLMASPALTTTALPRFAMEASEATLNTLESLRTDNVSSRHILSSTSGFKIQPITFLVIPAGVALLLLCFSVTMLVCDLSTPSNLLPLRWIPSRGGVKRALVGGKRIWWWGCALGSACHLAQMVITIQYGRLVSGVFEWHAWGDLGFFILFSSSCLSLITSLHSTPLLRETPYYTPPSVLTSPLVPAILTTILSLLLPFACAILLLLVLAGSISPVTNLHSLLQVSAVVLTNGTQGLNTSSVSSSLLSVEDLETVGVEGTDAVRGALESAWTSMGLVVRRQAGIKAISVGSLIAVLLLVELIVFIRYWRLVRNAKHEETPTYTMRPTNLRSHSRSSGPLVHPSHNFPPSSYAASLSRVDSSGSCIPALPHSPKLLPVFPQRTISQLRQPGTPHLHSSIPAPLTPSDVLPYAAYSPGSASTTSSSSSPSQPSYLPPSTPASSTQWPDDKPLLLPHQEINEQQSGDVICLPAAAFLNRKRPRTGVALPPLPRVRYGSESILSDEELKWDLEEEDGEGFADDRDVLEDEEASVYEEKPSWEELMRDIERTCERDLKASAMRRGGMSYKGGVTQHSHCPSYWGSEQSGSSFTMTNTGYGSKGGPRAGSRGGRSVTWSRETYEAEAEAMSRGSTSERKSSWTGYEEQGPPNSSNTGWQYQSRPPSSTILRSNSNLSSISTSSSSSSTSTATATSSTGMILKISRGGYRGPSSECLKALRASRLKDAAALLIALVGYGAILQCQSSFVEEVLGSQTVWTTLEILSHLYPLLSSLVILLFMMCRSVGTSQEKDLYRKTRWGKSLDSEGWWVPTEWVSTKGGEGDGSKEESVEKGEEKVPKRNREVRDQGTFGDLSFLWS